MDDGPDFYAADWDNPALVREILFVEKLHIHGLVNTRDARRAVVHILKKYSVLHENAEQAVEYAREAVADKQARDN